MSIWIFIVLIAQFLNAIVALVDKYIITSRAVTRPVTYAFYVSLLSAFAVVAFLFSWIPIPHNSVAIPSIANVESPDGLVLLISLFAGFAFFGALVALFTGLKRADTSDVIPVVGASSAVSSLLLGFYFLKTSLTTNFIWGFALLVLGTFFISLFRFKTKTLLVALISGVLFAVHFVCLKVLFEYTTFDNAFFWSRMGIVVPALLVLITPWVRLHSKAKGSVAEVPKKRVLLIILGNKFLAGVAGLMILKGIQLGDVIIVQALGGLQFVFLLLFAILTGHSLPQACGEKCSRYDVWQKIISVGIITIGFFVLFI
ncbi:MAG: EamA family transporter [Candidatus Paceibacterota bacterium]